jgi:hypothetical protein
MANDVSSTLRGALTKLEADRTRIDLQIEAVRSALVALDRGGRRASTRRVPRGRRRMSAAARKAVGARMKAYWAKRRVAKSATRTAKRKSRRATNQKKSGTAG